MSDDETNPQPDTPELGAIAELLNPLAEKPTADSAPAVPDEPPPDADAEKLETAPDDDESQKPEIDYDQEISINVGSEAEKLTIGQLKDHYQNSREFQQERDTWEGVRMDQQNENLVARQQVVEIAAMLGDVNPELITRLNNQRAATARQQSELLLQTFPEWADTEVKARDRVGLLETWKVLGFSDTEFGTLLTDHRFVKGLSDLTKFRAREAKARAATQVKVPTGQKPVQRKPTKAQAERNAIKRAKVGSQSDQNAAIGALIDGG